MNLKFLVRFAFLAIFSFAVLSTFAQDPNRFKDQVQELANAEYSFSPDKKLVVFAGSSSIRMWKDVQEYFPEYSVINNGFGGSHYSDLIFYYNELIKNRKPDILFIYEGDNDIAGKKKPRKVLKDAKELHKMIVRDLPETKVVIISPKPCISRWHLKKNYEKLNRKLERYTKRKDNLEYADVWTAMLDENGVVYQDIFIKDGVHMNKKGYDIWGEEIDKFLE